MDPTVTTIKPFSRIEPPLFLWVFAQITAGTVITDLIIFQTCHVLLGPDNGNCTIIHTNSSSPMAIALEQEIQPHISGVMILKSVITSLVPAITGLFLGSWSDKYGRKPLLVLSYFGPAGTFLLLTILSNYTVNSALLMLVFIPFALVGGWCSVILASLCYITDTTGPQQRALQMVLVEAAMSCGIFAGTFAGPALLEYGGYTAVFATATVSTILAGFYVLFFTKESLSVTNKPNYLEIFNPYVVKELAVIMFKQRIGYNRTVVWSCTMTLVLVMMVTEGDVAIGYMFTSARLGWNVSDFANFTATAVVCGTVGSVLGTQILKNYIDLSEMVVVMITNIFNITNQLIKAFTWQTWHMYLAAVFGMFNGVFSPMIRSVLSRSIPSHEVGKVFSVTVFVEMTAAFVASPLYNVIYAHYLPPKYPCPVWILSACIIVLMTIVCYFIRAYEKSYREVEYDTQNNVQNSVSE